MAEIPGQIMAAFKGKGSLLVVTTEKETPILILFKRLLGKSLIRKTKKRKALSKYTKKRKNKHPLAKIQLRGAQHSSPRECLVKMAVVYRKKTRKFNLL